MAMNPASSASLARQSTPGSNHVDVPDRQRPPTLRLPHTVSVMDFRKVQDATETSPKGPFSATGESRRIEIASARLPISARVQELSLNLQNLTLTTPSPAPTLVLPAASEKNEKAKIKKAPPVHTLRALQKVIKKVPPITRSKQYEKIEKLEKEEQRKKVKMLKLHLSLYKGTQDLELLWKFLQQLENDKHLGPILPNVLPLFLERKDCFDLVCLLLSKSYAITNKQVPFRDQTAGLSLCVGIVQLELDRLFEPPSFAFCALQAIARGPESLERRIQYFLENIASLLSSKEKATKSPMYLVFRHLLHITENAAYLLPSIFFLRHVMPELVNVSVALKRSLYPEHQELGTKLMELSSNAIKVINDPKLATSDQLSPLPSIVNFLTPP